MCEKVALEWTAASQECFSKAGVSCPSRPIHMDAHTPSPPHVCLCYKRGSINTNHTLHSTTAQVWGALVRQSPRTLSLVLWQPRELGISSALQMKKLALTRITSLPIARVFLWNHWNSICVTPTPAFLVHVTQLWAGTGSLWDLQDPRQDPLGICTPLTVWGALPEVPLVWGSGSTGSHGRCDVGKETA